MAYIERQRRKRPGKPDLLRWRARWSAPDGSERAKTFARKADADDFLVATEHAKRSGTYVNPQHGHLRFGDWVDSWANTNGDVRPSTRRRDDDYLRLYVLPRFVGTPLAGIEQADVQAWVNELSGRGLAPSTVTKSYQLLAKVMAAAVAARLLAASPCRGVRLPQIEREEMRFLSPVELELLASAVPGRYRALVLVGGWGGLRVGELGGLRRRDVDLARGTVCVAESAVEVAGQITVGPPKTKAAVRSVGLPGSVVADVGKHLGRYVDGAPDARVFTSPNGSLLSRTRFGARVWRPAVRTAGLEPLRVHDLRHTAVALWIEGGASPLEIARRAGHTSASVVLDRYGHLFPVADERLRTRLDELRAAHLP